MKAIILDMYGVVLKDTGDGFYSFVNRTFPELQHRDMFRLWCRTEQGEITREELFRALGYRENTESIEKEYLDTVEVNEGFTEFALQIRRKYKLAILSNDISEWSRYLRGKFRLDEYFDLVTVSGDIGISKPDERIFRYALERLGCEPQDCIYVDDRRNNLKTAEVLGMQPILFNSRNVDYDGVVVNSFRKIREWLEEKDRQGNEAGAFL